MEFTSSLFSQINNAEYYDGFQKPVQYIDDDIDNFCRQITELKKSLKIFHLFPRLYMTNKFFCEQN